MYFFHELFFSNLSALLGTLPVDQLKHSKFNKEERIKLSLAQAHMQSQTGPFESTVVTVDYFNCFFFLERKTKGKMIYVWAMNGKFLNLLIEILILFKSEFLIHLPLTCYERKNNQSPFLFDYP